MNLLLTIYEFYATRNIHFWWRNVLISLILGFLVYGSSDIEGFKAIAENIRSSIINVLAVLVGFSISLLTMVTTSSSKEIEKIKAHFTELILYNKRVSLYKVLIINMGYIILIESLLLIFNLIYPFFVINSYCANRIMFAINIGILTHVIFANTHSIIEFYLILTADDRDNK